MPVLTVSRSTGKLSGSFSDTVLRHVLALSHHSQVGRIYASRVTADMMQDIALWNLPDYQLVEYAEDAKLPLCRSDVRVALTVTSTIPSNAAIRLNHATADDFLGRHRRPQTEAVPHCRKPLSRQARSAAMS